MKKRLLAMLLAFAIVLVSIPFGTMQVNAAEIPEGAPFTALTTDKGDVLGYKDMGTVAYSTYEDVPYYHVTIPSGATEVYVTHPSGEDPFADADYKSAYGYYASTEDWTGGYMTYSFEEVKDGYKITLPLSATVEDFMNGTTYELSFVKDEKGNIPYAVAVERNDYSPIAFFTFEYAAEEHTCSFGDWEQTKAPTCTTEGEETGRCECGKTETKSVDAKGHSFSNGSCSVCGVADPDYVAPEIPDDTAPENAPFTAITTDDGTVIAAEKITFVKNVKYNDYGITFPYYHVKVPAGTTYIDVTYPESANASDYAYYADTTNWKGEFFYAGGTGRLPLNEVEMSFVSENGNAAYAVATESDNNGCPPIAFFTFEYEEGTTPEVPSDEPERKFTQITAGSTAIAESAIEYKGSFSLGDNPDGDDDGYPYIHEVPYYIVTVPTGTETVDITYKADTKIMTDNPTETGITARGYRTKIDESVDLTASATVYGTGFNNGYTKNSDGTQTVKTNVKDNTKKSDGYRWAITVEESDPPFAAVTLFSFNYEAHEHNYETKVTDPSCDKAGYTTHTCTLCFDSYKDNETEATGHDYKGVVTKPTCTEKGYTTYTCEICKKSYTADETEATGHTADGEGAVTAPTCIEKGYTTYTCEICKESYTADETSATGHSYEEEVIASTCTTKGYTLHTCSVCGDNYKDNETELTDHNYDENGCTVCGAPAEVDGAYQIGSEAALRWFETYVEAGNTTANAKLTADITVESSWNGIGRFAGSFDGNGKTVTFTNATNGLFAYVEGTSAKRAEIKNVTVGGAISGDNYVAGIAGKTLFANIINCINNADITGGSNVAGIAGGGNSDTNKNTDITITNCSNNGKITATGNYIGGIVGGYATGGSVIEKCCNTGYVKGNSNVGGIVGWIKGYPSNSSVTNCYNTGKVEGSSNTGGIAGEQGNASTPVTNCYNAGECTNAITGKLYTNASNHSKSAKAYNTYYLTTASAQAAPVNQLHAYFSATAKSAVEMSSAEFAALLGNAFQASCPSPVFTTQTAKDHTMVDGVCSVCNYGNAEKAEFTVTMPTDERIIVKGETKATEGEDYTFKVEFATGYMAGENFAVTATNYDIVDNGDGTYTVKNVISDLTITVSDIVKAEFTVTLPGLGNGYVVSPAEGSTSPVNKGEDYSFTVEIKDGFKKGTNFAVKANDKELVDKNGVYTIKNVTEKYVITVEDVDIITPKDKVSIEFTITKGQTKIYRATKTGKTMLMQKLDVPYFDLADYGLERYYYNPYCYLDKDGNEVLQSAGTRESAYGNITAMHALICATEVFYLGYDAKDAGTGLSYRSDSNGDGRSDFDEAISWSQGAGSSFMDLWDFGTNLNYYLNYTYPLGKATWGSTSDQILIKDGDIFTAHMITDTDESGSGESGSGESESGASGSNFPFFIVNDTNGEYDISNQATHYGTTVEIYDQVDRATVKQGENVEVTLYLANPATGYTTAYTVQANKKLYMVESYNLIPDLNADVWMFTGYVTDKDGKVVISTADLEPGTYYFAAKGGTTPGGQDLGDGFKTTGGETGVAVFELTVEAGETPSAPKTYTVNIPVADAYTVDGATKVEGGTDYTFTVKVNEGYEKGDNFAVRVNGVVINAVDTDTYTVENVAADIEITVEGVEETAQTPTTPEVKPGDFDGDGSVTMLDVSDAFDAYMNETELTQTQKQAADFNNNGIIDMVEVSDVFDIYMNE